MLVIGVDCSTTASKAIAYSPSGGLEAEGRAEFPLYNPEPDGWEQDAESWWTSTLAALRHCVEALGPRAKSVRALALTHQRETFVLTDGAGKPLHPALVWMDSRGRAEVGKAVAHLGAERLLELSGKPPCITPSLYKLLGLFERRPELRAAHPVMLDVHAFLAWRMTGRRATSLASADPLGLIDMRQRTWSEELLGLAGLEPGQMPELVEPGTELGRLRADVARAVGLEPDLPLIAGAGDGQCAGLGAGIVTPGRAYLNLGTAVVSGVLSREYRVDSAFRTLYGAAPATFFLETDLKGGTFTLTWLAEKWAGPGQSVSAILAGLEHQAAKLPPGSEGLVLVPYWNGVMNPYWDDDASGIVIGWSGRHEPKHLYRAILEGIAFEQRLHTSGVERAIGAPLEELIVMGGGAKSALFCQILADVLDRRIVRARTSEATALGAGILAAVGAGAHGSVEDAVPRMTGTAEAFEPGKERERFQRLYAEVYVGLYPALRDALTRLTSLTR